MDSLFGREWVMRLSKFWETTVKITKWDFGGEIVNFWDNTFDFLGKSKNVSQKLGGLAVPKKKGDIWVNGAHLWDTAIPSVLFYCVKSPIKFTRTGTYPNILPFWKLIWVKTPFFLPKLLFGNLGKYPVRRGQYMSYLETFG